MCIFDVGKEKQEWMEQEGFLLPENYRFTQEVSRF